jgi:WD repeat-containing protein 61
MLADARATAHDDAVWAVNWTVQDRVLSISADGSLRQWNPSSGDSHPPNTPEPTPHTLGLTSLSTSANGSHALTNSIEGLTTLWDLGDDNGSGIRQLASHESFARSASEESEAGAFSSASLSTHVERNYLFSLVNIPAS